MYNGRAIRLWEGTWSSLHERPDGGGIGMELSRGDGAFEKGRMHDGQNRRNDAAPFDRQGGYGLHPLRACIPSSSTISLRDEHPSLLPPRFRHLLRVSYQRRS